WGAVASPRSAVFEKERVTSLQNVLGAADEDAGAAGLTPDAHVGVPRGTIVVVAGDELAVFDPQLAVEEMQLFHPRMGMRGVARAGREAHQHADKVPLLIRREQLALDPRCDLLPVRLGP